MSNPSDLLTVEEALELLLSHVDLLEAETVSLTDAVGRIAAQDMTSDIDISPFDHAAMDGFAVHAADLEGATPESPVECAVIAEVPAGSFYDGPIGPNEVVRIMTGAPLPAAADSVVKYEIVTNLENEGRAPGRVAFTEPCALRSNVRSRGEEIAQGEVAIATGELISAAGVGFLASCGISEVSVYRRPRVAVLSIGSELVTPDQMPEQGQIRDGNSYAIASCVMQAGGIPTVLPIVADNEEALAAVVDKATREYDFVVTTGGASDGDYDFIKLIVDRLGDLYMTLVNMRPGKSQTFGLVNGTPVFGLPGNPAAAYCGFEILIRQALRKMQGATVFERPRVKACLTRDNKKKDKRRIFLRASLSRNEAGELEVTPAKNQNSGLFSAIQRGNCLAILPDGVPDDKKIHAGTVLDCVLLDVEEGVIL